FRKLDCAVHELLVEVMLDRLRAKADQAALAERCPILPKRAEDQLPATIILRFVDRARVAHTLKPLQQHHHREQRGGTGLLPTRVVRSDELILELIVEQLLSDRPQKHEKLARTAKAVSNRLLPSPVGGFPAHPSGRSPLARRVDPPSGKRIASLVGE